MEPVVGIDQPSTIQCGVHGGLCLIYQDNSSAIPRAEQQGVIKDG